MTELTCEICGDAFSVERVFGVPPKSCSEECRKAYRSREAKKYREKNKEAIALRMKKWRSENAESIKEYNSKYYKENPEYFERKNREWNAANAEAVAEYNYKWYRENIEVAKNASKRWRLSNPDKVRTYQSNRRSLKRNAWVEDVSLDVLLEESDWTCGICREPIPKEVNYGSPLYPSLDHIIPLSKGGEHSYANTQPAHFSCNTRKRDKIEGWESLPSPLKDNLSECDSANAGRGES